MIPDKDKLTIKHVSSVTGHIPDSLKFHNNGKHLVGIMGECILATDLSDKNSQRMLRGHDDHVTCIDCANTQDLVVSGQVGNNSDVLIWQFSTGKIRFRLSEHDHKVSVVKFSDDDRLILSSGNFMDKKLFIWDSVTGYIVGSTALTEAIVCAAWGGKVRDFKWRETPKYRFACCYISSIAIWELNAQNGALQQEIINTGVSKREYTCIAFSPCDQRYIVCGTKSADFFIISVKNKCLQRIVKLGTLGISAVTTTPNLIIFGCGDGTVALYSEKGQDLELETMITVKSRVTSLSSYQNEILVGTDFSQALILSMNTMHPNLVQESHNKRVTFLKYFDGKNDLFASACDDNSIRFWNSKTNSVINRIYSRNAGAPVCVQVREEIMLSGWEDGALRMHELTNSTQLWQIDNTHKFGITSLDFSPDSKFICTGGGDGVVRVWELRSRSMASNLKEHAHKITKVKLINGGGNLITSSRDKSLLLWDLSKEKRIAAFCLSMGGINSFDINEGSSMMISTGQDRKITFWDLRQNKPQRTLSTDPNIDLSEECFSLRTKSDDSAFFTAGTGNTLKLWDVNQGKMISAVRCHSKGINSIDLSPDNKELVSAGEDASIAVWDVSQ